MDVFALEVPEGPAPLFARIAHALAADVRRGRLRAGDALPGSRTLAKTLGVHRNTVLAALRELELEGWIETTSARVTRIRAELPDPSPRAVRGAAIGRRADALGFELAAPLSSVASPPVPKGAIALLGGLPDLKLVPARQLARAFRRTLTSPRAAELLGYGDPRGEEPLRVALAGLLSRARGLAVSADDIVVTRGSQMALYLAGRAVIEPGDRVAVEELGYRPAWEALRAAGAELVPIPVDGRGLVVDAVEEAAAQARRAGARLRAVYVTPHHQYPTTVLLGSARRLALLELARRERLAVFEDDYDHEFHYDGRPVVPLASADRTGQVIYFGTLSKILAPALRIGFVVAPAPLLERVATLRTLVDRQGDRLMERAIAELAVEGELSRHARKMRRIYAARRDVLASALHEQFAGDMKFDVPPGGMALWVRAPGIDVEAWAESCSERGVVFQTARRFTFARAPARGAEARSAEHRSLAGMGCGKGAPRRALRVGFAAEPEARLRLGVRRMAEALATLRRQRGLRRAEP